MRGVDRIWGFTPHATTDSRGMTRLFELQNRLKADLRRQARLAKQDVSEVRSTQAEHLRRVNQAILGVSTSVEGAVDPFAVRNLNAAQIKSEDALSRHGIRRIGGAPMRPASVPGSKSVTLRPKSKSMEVKPYGSRPPEELFALRGPLAREFSRARDRGYKGPPNRWLAGPHAAMLVNKLRARGFDLELPRRGGLFSVHSALQWATKGCSVPVGIDRSHGFARERLYRVTRGSLTHARQARAVPRLPRSRWPSHDGQLLWPTFPTLNESWEMYMRGKSPASIQTMLPRRADGSLEKRPLRQVKPGSAARAVSKFVLGIRADIEVPRKFLGYFKYRWGFLILRRHGFLKRDFVTYVTKLWKSEFSGMFLKVPIRYNDALRLIPSTMYYTLLGFVAGGVAPSLSVKKGRQRPPRSRRFQNRENRQSGLHGLSNPSQPSSSDKSDDGVRLY